ncbi:MAG: large conductance mechanosensitive channel protein MscL [Clostridia bacterium]|nr:large conductance mechanosensitive channel protein MscL [Clostridia bacterium]
MKKFFKEFKDFISRGNVLDMAVGIIVGGAFTAIITALVNHILTPLINWIPGADNTGALQVVLRKAVLDAEGNTITDALIIDFGAVISAVVTFLITAFVLFLIIKAINTIRAGGRKVAEKQKKAIEKKLKKGEITAEEAEAQQAAVKAPAEVAPVETTDDLLREIRDLLKAQNVKAAVDKLDEKVEK